jgi:hypothetical protein
LGRQGPGTLAISDWVITELASALSTSIFTLRTGQFIGWPSSRAMRRRFVRPALLDSTIPHDHAIINDIMMECHLATVVTINRPDVVALIQSAADQLTAGNKTEAVALAMRSLLEKTARTGSLFGAHPASVRVRDGVDLTAPILQDPMDAETGHEIDR